VNQKPPRFCASCRQVHAGKCPKQKPWQGSGKGRGGRPWRRKRKRVFERDLYLCQRCKRKGKLTPVELHGPNAGVCDHIKPLAQGGTDDEENLEAICKACDKEKTAAER
jgi:5-methylcytosine-specific restriction protein A